MIYNYKNAAVIGAISGAIVDPLSAIFYNSKVCNNKESSNFESEIVQNVKYLENNISFDYKNCPKSNYYLKASINEYNSLTSFEKQEQSPAFREFTCNIYNKMISKTEVTSAQIMKNVKKAFDLIELTVQEDSDPVLLILGENHFDQEAFLLEALILTYLKEHELSSKFLIERSPNYDNSTALNKFADINPVHFAQHVLGYNLIGIDPHNENYETPELKREKAMGRSIYKNLLNSPDKVTVVSVGSGHLPFFKDNMKAENINVLLLNLHKVELMHNFMFTEERLEKLKDIELIESGVNLESMSFEQVLDIYQDCLKNNYSGIDLMYTSKSYIDYCDNVADDLPFC